MKKYDSFLATTFEQYLHYRQSVGYSIIALQTYLVHFDRFVHQKQVQWHDLDSALCLEFSEQLELSPTTINNAMSALKGFFSYLERCEVMDDNPMAAITEKKIPAYIPYLFSAQDIGHLLDAVNNKIRKDPKNYFRDYTLSMLILLLSGCGLRISEPLNLKLNGYHAGEGTIFIRKTKFDKERLIPVPRSVMGELSNYLSVRKHMVANQDNPYLFPGKDLFRIDRGAVYALFYQAVRDIGIEQEKKIFDNIRFGKPTPHCLRHSFAVNTLLRIKESGKSAQDALPVLAAYMGHKNYISTAVYLKALDAKQRQGLFDITVKGFKVI